MHCREDSSQICHWWTCHLQAQLFCFSSETQAARPGPLISVGSCSLWVLWHCGRRELSPRYLDPGSPLLNLSTLALSLVNICYSCFSLPRNSYALNGFLQFRYSGSSERKVWSMLCDLRWYFITEQHDVFILLMPWRLDNDPLAPSPVTCEQLLKWWVCRVVIV